MVAENLRGKAAGIHVAPESSPSEGGLFQGLRSLFQHAFANFGSAAATVFLFLAATFAYLSFTYSDIINTIENANILIDAVLEGRVLEFYDISAQRATTNFSANYQFPIYVLFAIWQAPMYAVVRFVGRDYLGTAVALQWSKALVFLFLFALAYALYRVILLCTSDRRRASLCVFLLLSSAFTFYSVFVVCQLDVICLTFMLWGVYWYLQGQMKRFWICFLCAVPFKMFALFLALPLMLFRQKNLVKALAWWGTLLAPVVLERFAFGGSDIYSVALAAQNGAALDALISSFVTFAAGKEVCIFVGCYLAIILFSYIKQPPNASVVLYICYCIWASFVGTVTINSYWVMLVVPFLVSCLCVNDRYFKAGVLVETLGGVAYFLHAAATGAGPTRQDGMVGQLLLAKMGIVQTDVPLKYETLHGLLQHYGIDAFAPVLSTVYVVALAALAVLMLPKFQQPVSSTERLQLLLLARALAACLACGLYVYGYAATTEPYVYDMRQEPSVLDAADLIAPDNPATVAQRFLLEDSKRLDELVLMFDNTRFKRDNMALVYVSLQDAQTSDCVFSSVLGCSQLESGKEVTVGLGGVLVQADVPYDLVLTGKPNTPYWQDTTHLYPYCASSGEIGRDGLSLSPVVVNGNPSDSVLYFALR